jgi:hypothetical protein
VAGTGFFDPGPDLAPPALPFHHISATVTGGVVVNGVTYLTPTTVKLDLNTVSATPGAVNVTITNPDGQSATGVGILHATLPAPTGMVATADTTSTVQLNWATVGADSYNVYYTPVIGPFTFIGNVPAPPAVASPLPADTTTLYRVTAVDSSAIEGPPSAFDLATTTIFTEPVVAGSTTVKAQQITETRTAVTAVLAASGLPAMPFASAVLAGDPIQAVHYLSMRLVLDAAYSALGLLPIGYTYSLAVGTRIRADDLKEIQNATK